MRKKMTGLPFPPRLSLISLPFFRQLFSGCLLDPAVAAIIV